MADFTPDVVSSTLVFGSVPIDSAAFNVPLILTSHASSVNRADTYTNYQAVLDAGYHPESPAAKMSNLLFQGVAKPSKVVIGRRAITNFAVDVVGAVTNSTVYSVKLKSGTVSKTFSYTATVPTDVANDVVTALKAAIDGDAVFSLLVTTALATDTLEITPIATKTVDVAAVANVTAVTVGTETAADAITAVAAESTDWFWMLSDDHSDTSVKAVAAYAEANERVYAFTSQDADILNKVSGNTLEDLSLLGYQNTWFVMYSADADVEFPEAGGVGAIAQANPGTTTMQGKTLKGVTVNSLTTTQIQNILDWNGNVYLREYGVNFYRDGRVVNGDFVDYLLVA